jgi:hypothetical protein
LVVVEVSDLFGGHVVGCAHVGLGKFRMFAHFSAESEISQLDVVGVVDEDVGWLDVPVQHLAAATLLVCRPAVAVLQSQQQLVGYLPDHFFRNRLDCLLAFFQVRAQVAA